MGLDMKNPGALAGAAGAKNAKADEAGRPQVTRTGRRAQWAAQTRWKAANPLAVWAHIAARSAERRGLIARPDRCERCKAVGAVDAHHADHTLPLVVTWLCRRCHRWHHAETRRAAT